MKLLKATLAIALATLPVAPGTAQETSASATCTCTVPLGDVSKAIGRIDASNGKVLATVDDGLRDVKAGQDLFLGSQVLTGKGGSAKIVLNASASAQNVGCTFNMGSNAELALFATSKEICAMVNKVEIFAQSTGAGAVKQAEGAALGAGAGAGGGAGATTLLVVGGAAAMAGIAFGLGGGSEPASN